MSRRLAIPRPTDFGNVGGWWTAQDRTATIISGDIDAWPDRSGNGLDLPAVSSSGRPALVTNGVNGRSVGRFSAATNDYLIKTGLSITHLTNTWWFVVKATTQLSGLLLAWDGGSIKNGVFGSSTNTLNMAGGVSFLGTQSLTGAFRSYVFIFNGASSSVRVNGAQVFTGTHSAAGTITEIRIGACVNFLDGDLADFGFFTSIPSVTDFEKYYLRRIFRTW